MWHAELYKILSTVGILWLHLVIFLLPFTLIAFSHCMPRVFCRLCKSLKSAKDPHSVCPDCRVTCDWSSRCCECRDLPVADFRTYKKVVRKRFLQKRRRMSSTPPAAVPQASPPPPPPVDVEVTVRPPPPEIEEVSPEESPKRTPTATELKS